MKEILKEWKQWLGETKPTDKWFDKFGGKPRPKSTRTPLAPMYDRAVRKSAAQGDFQGTFKVWFGQFLKSNYVFWNMEFLVSKMSEEDRAQAVRELNIMRHIYSGKSQFDIYNTDNLKTGVMYDNQPEVKGSAVEKIDSILNDMGEKPTLAVPTDEEAEEVYVYYIHPNWSLTKAPPVPEEIKSRFTKNIALTQTPDFVKRQAELDALNRQKAIERKRELARRRRERRRNK